MARDPTPQDTMRHPDSPASPAEAGPLFQGWQAEAVRLREAHWGPLEDRIACQMAMHEKADLTTRILARAAWLARHSGLQARLRQWATGARWALIALWAGAALAGAGAAATALGQPQGAINLSLALLAFLGLHALTFLIWLASCLPGIPPSTALSRLWLWLTRRLVRGPDSALAAQAFLSLLARTRAWKSALGLVSHGAWTLAFLGMLPTLVVLLSTRRYTFHWETTLLSPHAFVTFTHALGAWPQALGFPPPAPFEIAASAGPQALAAGVQAGWSWWLVGCVLAWGLLPRLAALALCAIHLRRRLRQPLIDPRLPGWLELRERLLPSHRNLGIDRQAPDPAGAAAPARRPLPGRDQAAILGYELGAGMPWPPAGLPDDIQDLGRCDSREDRQRIRALLDPAPPHLLLVCDARQTPDRGTRAWFDELRHRCADLRVLCPEDAAGPEAPPRDRIPNRLAAWSDMLTALDIPRMRNLPEWLTHIGHPRHG
jgi:hypothetical protein